MFFTKVRLGLLALSLTIALPTGVSMLMAASEKPPTRGLQQSAPATEGYGKLVETVANDAGRQTSKTKKESIELAARAFGPNHWAAREDLAFRYFNSSRGYWLYAREYQKSDDGKYLVLNPVAIILRSSDGQRHMTATGDVARVNLNMSMDKAASSGKFSDLKVSHASIEGNVVLRDDKATPDRTDDLIVGPLHSLEFDGPEQRLRTELEVVIQDHDLRITGSSLVIQLRSRDEPWSVQLKQNVKIDVRKSDAK